MIAGTTHTAAAIQIAIATIGALVATVALIPVVRRVAIRKGVVAIPRVERWNSTATPYLGGVAIAVSSLVAVLIGAVQHPAMSVLFFAALGVAGVGLVDDLRPATITIRLIVEGVGGFAVAMSGVRLHALPAVPDVIVTAFILIVLANAFNYVDNIDGALALVSMVTAAAIVVVAVWHNNFVAAYEAAAIVGSCIGFVFFNWHPASIFMGDVGSLLLGFVLGALAFDVHLGANGADRVVTMGLLMFVPLFDMTIVYVARTLERRPLHIGGTDHTSHRLVRAGVSVRVVSVVMVAVSALSTAAALVIERNRIGLGLLVPVMISLVVLLAVVVIRLRPRSVSAL